MKQLFLSLITVFLLVCPLYAQEQLSKAEQTEAEIFAQDYLCSKDSSLSFGTNTHFTIEHIDQHIVVLGCRRPLCGIILIRSAYVGRANQRVLGYSTESTIGHNSNSMKGLLGYYETIVAKSIVNGIATFVDDFESLPKGKGKPATTLLQQITIGPLLKDYELKQFDYSEVVDGITYTRRAGCGIIRLIQLMLYYNYPTSIQQYRCELGHASKLKSIIPKDSLIHLDRFMCERINAIINHLDGRKDTIMHHTVDIDEITPLAHFIATATDSEFHTGWTSTNSQGTLHALTEHLGFSRKMEISHNSTVGEMYNRILCDLTNAHPVLVSGGGHGFICDGINANGYLHFNLGWGGQNNGWYRFPVSDEKLRSGFLRSYITGVVPRK